jgi:hypothetical protein
LRKFTFDDTLRGEAPFGQLPQKQLGGRSKNIYNKQTNKQDSPAELEDFLQESNAEVFKKPTMVENNQTLQIKIKTEDGHLIDFQNDSSPIRSKTN